LYGKHLIALVLVLLGVSLGTGLIGSRRMKEKRE